MVRALFVHESAIREVADVTDPNLWEGSLGELVDGICEHYKEYRCLPMPGQMHAWICEQGDPAVIAELTQALTDVLDAEPANPDWTIKNVRSMAAEHKLRLLAADIPDYAATGDYEAAMKDARAAWQLASPAGEGDTGVGTEEAVRARHNGVMVPIPTGLPYLDEKMNGGLGKGRFGCFLGKKGGGKTHTLVHLGAAACRAGYRVLHVSLELTKEQTRARYDRSLLGLTFEEFAREMSEHFSTLKELQEHLTIWDGSKRRMSLGGLINVLDRQDEEPDILILDYAQRLKSTAQGKDFMASRRAGLMEIHAQLRELARKRGIAIWTAHQVNRGGVQKQGGSQLNMITTADASEAIDALWDDDVVISLNQTRAMAALGHGVLYVCENNDGENQIEIPVMMDWVRSQLLTREEEDE